MQLLVLVAVFRIAVGNIKVTILNALARFKRGDVVHHFYLFTGFSSIQLVYWYGEASCEKYK